MRTVIRRRPAVVAGALAGLALASLLLSGCVTAPAPRPTSTPHATPLFATDAEALAAATKAYAAYLAMSDTIAHDGGANPDRIKEFVTPKWEEHEIRAFEKLQKLDLHQEGESKFDKILLQSRSEGGFGEVVAAYVCSDSAGTRILDSKNDDVTPVQRVTKLTSVVSFKSSAEDPDRLLLDRYEPWSGSSIC